MEAATDAARVAAMVKQHGEALLRVARRHSLCEDDAHDALQRGLEIYLRRLDRVDPATEVAWLKVVVKHEAMAVRRARSDSVTSEEIELRRAPRRHPALRRGARRERRACRPLRRSASTTRRSRSCSRPRASPTREIGSRLSRT